MQSIKPSAQAIIPEINKYLLCILLSHFFVYFKITPGKMISPKPIKEHLEIGVKSSTKNAGHQNFNGKSIEVATLAITDCPKK